MTVGELNSDDYAAIQELTNSLQADDRVAAAYSISTVGEQVEARLTPEQLSLLQQDERAS